MIKWMKKTVERHPKSMVERAERELIRFEDTYVIYDNGGATVDLTVRELARVVSNATQPLKKEKSENNAKLADVKLELATMKDKARAVEDSESPMTKYSLTTCAGGSISIEAHGYTDSDGWLLFWVYTKEVEVVELYGIPVLASYMEPTEQKRTNTEVLRKINKANIIEIKEG